MAGVSRRRLPASRLPAPAASVLLVVGLILAAAGTGRGSFFVADQPPPRLRFEVEALRERAEAIRTGSTAGRDATQLPGVVETALSGVLLVAAVLLAVAVTFAVVRGVARVRRLVLPSSRGGRRAAAFDPGEGTDEDSTEPLRRRLARSLDVVLPAVGSGGEPREAVVACYVGMERALEEAGTVRRPAETATELLSRVLTEQTVPAEDVKRLTDLFYVARFGGSAGRGGAVIDDGMRSEAVRSLTRVRDALTGPGSA